MFINKTIDGLNNICGKKNFNLEKGNENISKGFS